MNFFGPTTLAKVFGGFYAAADGSCPLCGGPVAKGEPAVPIEDNGSAHRSCVFMDPKDVLAFRRRRVPKAKPVVEHPNQLDLWNKR